MKQKILALLLIICMIATMIPTALAEETKPLLSEMTDAEILAFLEENEIELPQRLYSDETKVMQYVRDTIAEIEDNPAIRYNYSNTELHRFSTEVQVAINTYYGIDLAQIPSTIAENYGLIDSTFLSMPSNVEDFNCYGYATGSISTPTGWKNPGQFSASSAHLGDLSVSEMADLIVADLKSSDLNKPCVKKTTTRPSTGDVIALRLETSNPGNYHVMRLFSGQGSWRHKTGKNALMIYKYNPSYARLWTAEGVNKSYYVGGYDTKYDSSIYYIAFQSAHSYSSTSTYTGYNYHSGSYHYYEYANVCSFCGGKKNITYQKETCSGNCSDINKLPHEDVLA